MKIKKIKDSIFKFRSNIGDLKNIKELADAIKIKKLEKISFYLLLIWIFTPLLMSIKIIFWNDQILNKYFYSQIVLSLYWYQILQQIGYLGLIIMIVIILKNYYQYNTIKDYITNNSSIFALGLLFLWSIISTILSESFNLSFFGSMYRKEGLLTYFTYIGVFYLGLSLKSKETVSRIMKIFVFTSLIISLLMIIDIEQVNSGLGFYPNSAVFYNINHFGYYLCMAIITAAGLALKSGKKKIYYFNLMFFSILVSALIKNKSFGPYLAVIAGLLFLAILIWQLHKSLFRRVITIILLFITISFVINISTGFFANEISRLGNSVTDIVKDNESAGKAGSGRWELWVGGIEFALEKPFFGYGPDNLESRYLEEDIEQDRPHNIFIQIAASLGIPALIFYLSALIIHFRKLWKNKQELTILNIAINAIVFTYLASSFFGNSMFYTSPFYIMFLGIAIGNLDKHCQL